MSSGCGVCECSKLTAAAATVSRRARSQQQIWFGWISQRCFKKTAGICIASLQFRLLEFEAGKVLKLNAPAVTQDIKTIMMQWNRTS